MSLRVAVITSLLLSACTYGGHYQRSGPCEGWHSDQAACLRAHDNSATIGKVQIGQTLAEVRSIMGKDPERRSATANTESWGYLTSYSDHLVTTVVFTDGVVTAITQGSAGD
jgi:hypothetical protein